MTVALPQEAQSLLTMRALVSAVCLGGVNAILVFEEDGGLGTS